MSDFLPFLFAQYQAPALITLAGLYVLLINMMTFAAFGVDKHQAMNDKRRVSEATLLGLALAGGSLGAKAAQRRYNHKTRKQPFKTLLNLILVAQIGTIALSQSPYAGQVTGYAEEMIASLAPEPAEPAEPERTLPRRFGPGS